MRRMAISAAIAMVLAGSASARAASPVTEALMENGRSAQADIARCYVDMPQPGQVLCDFRTLAAFEGWSRDMGERTRGDRVCLSTSTFIQGVTGELTSIEFGSGCSTDADVAIDRDLGAASIRGSVTILRIHCEPETGQCEEAGSVEVSLDVGWTATGPADRNVVRTREEVPTEGGTCIVSTFSNGLDRAATASGVLGGDAMSFDSAGIHEGVYKFSVSCRA